MLTQAAAAEASLESRSIAQATRQDDQRAQLLIEVNQYTAPPLLYLVSISPGRLMPGPGHQTQDYCGSFRLLQTSLICKYSRQGFEFFGFF